jgi:hypothetical protein
VPQDVTPDDETLARFAQDLQALRHEAGKPSYDELAKRTHFGRTVLSAALNGKAVPSWPVTSALVTALGGDPETWRPRWAALSGPTETGPAAREPRRAWLRWSWLCLVAVLAAVGFWFVFLDDDQPSGVTDASMTAPAAGVAGGRCMRVTGNDIRVFTEEHGDEPWTRWLRDTKFWADPDASSTRRYRVTLHSGRYGWVTTDQRYVAPADGCP